MEHHSTMGRIRELINKPNEEQEYEPLDDDSSEYEDDDVRRAVLIVPDYEYTEEPFSWFEYCIFFLLGISMLWAWNMFLAAAPYFQARFAGNDTILNSFQSAITSVSCVTNMSSMLILAHIQHKANYPKRILTALVLNLIVFTLLCLSTRVLRDVSAVPYFAFTLIMVFSTSIATGLAQNGGFAFASSYGRKEYISAILTGQAVAGVLPSAAQIVSVLISPAPDKTADEQTSAKLEAAAATDSAFVYFLTATIISVITIITVLPVIRKYRHTLEFKMMSSMASIDEAEQAARKSVTFMQLYKKLYWLTASVFLCFAITMFFPVFTPKVLSIIPEDEAPRLFQPSVYIPLAFLVWNVGDLVGRITITIKFFVVRKGPILLVAAILRAGFLPLYLLCNIRGKGAVIKSDTFYLFGVQFLFGATNGWLSSLCMTEAGEKVTEGEREATGGFMALNLVAGLTVGSLLSFAVGNV
ncbi:MFS general substrate transporter [Glarea lozoyensis ATCC 20868]|uniref:MFS general substrate transporter n=1 Tax=Glarea lozoyensis (strain ATCC 20868 / MF5171) TaxID=1116229 RepID=S3DI11_GLAL2|nr:MFS general substrate transporter [Glarea lozoyensis ATCC 20868]EPE31676.1 MFS general substrate transporter [Glarea lozoyensis ATCC 20868]